VDGGITSDDSQASEALASVFDHLPRSGGTPDSDLSTRCRHRKPQDLRDFCILGTPQQGGLLRAQVLRDGVGAGQLGAVHISHKWSRRNLEASGLDVFRSVYLRSRVASHWGPSGVHDDSLHAGREWSMGRISIERWPIDPLDTLLGKRLLSGGGASWVCPTPTGVVGYPVRCQMNQITGIDTLASCQVTTRSEAVSGTVGLKVIFPFATFEP
jgi:hypothetical protein